MPRSSDGKFHKALRQAALLLLAAGVAAAMSAAYHGLPKTSEEQNEIALEEALKQHPLPLWIDARPTGAFETEHIPEALALNAEDWNRLLPTVLEQWEPGRSAVVYCDSPGQAESREVAERLREFNLGRVWILQGGWKAWKSK